MSKYSQKDAVYAAVTAFLAENGRQFDDGMKVDLGSDDRKTVVAMISGAIEAGEVEFTAEAAAKYNSSELLRGYVTGLLSNWLRKDERLNGGEKHTIKKPGSRIGQSDPTIKALRAMQKQLTDSSEIEAVENEINLRLAEIRVDQLQSSKKDGVNLDLIPASLRHLYK